jgi:hypothetical protein
VASSREATTGRRQYEQLMPLPSQQLLVQTPGWQVHVGPQPAELLR